MMKNIAIINNVDFGSTGQISLNLHRNLLAKGYRSYFCYGRGASLYRMCCIYISDMQELYILRIASIDPLRKEFLSGG